MVLVKRWLQLRFDCDSTFIELSFNCRSTAIRLKFDHSTNYVTTRLLHCGLKVNKLCGRPPAPALCNVRLLTLKVVSESLVTWATSVPISVFLGLSVLDFGPMYVTDRRQTSDSIIA